MKFFAYRSVYFWLNAASQAGRFVYSFSVGLACYLTDDLSISKICFIVFRKFMSWNREQRDVNVLLVIEN